MKPIQTDNKKENYNNVCEQNVLALKATKHSFEAVKNENAYFSCSIRTNVNTYKRKYVQMK